MMVIRRARAGDATAMGTLYVRVWQHAFPALVPHDVLLAMCPAEAARRWHVSLAASGAQRGVYVAQGARGGLLGMGSFGPSRDKGLGYTGEVFTLYVDGDHEGQGIGRVLMATLFAGLLDSGAGDAVSWTMAHNHNRFFFEALGGRVVGRKLGRVAGMPVPLVAYGWPDLAATLDRLERSGALSQPFVLRPEPGAPDQADRA